MFPTIFEAVPEPPVRASMGSSPFHSTLGLRGDLGRNGGSGDEGIKGGMKGCVVVFDSLRGYTLFASWGCSQGKLKAIVSPGFPRFEKNRSQNVQP